MSSEDVRVALEQQLDEQFDRGFAEGLDEGYQEAIAEIHSALCEHLEGINDNAFADGLGAALEIVEEFYDE